MTDSGFRARVGTSGWKKPPWRGHFYPSALSQARELEFAARWMATVEVNATFHGFQAPASFQAWRAEVRDDFVFSVKGSKVVTHDRRLEVVGRSVAEFFASGILFLQEKLGPVLWQLPPSLGFRPAALGAFLGTLPHSLDEARYFIARHEVPVDPALLKLPDRPIRQCLEVRNAAFRNPGFVDMLRRHDIAAVVTNSPGWPAIDAVTSDFVYVRLHGDATHFPDGYDDAVLERWAGRVAAWLDGSGAEDGMGRDVFVYFDNPDHRGIRSPFDAIKLQGLVGGWQPGAGATLQPPLWDD